MSEPVNNKTNSSEEQKSTKVDLKLIFQIIVILLFGSFLYVQFINPDTKVDIKAKVNKNDKAISSDFKEKVLPKDGIIIPVRWGSLGKQMIEKGVIDEEKFNDIYKKRGGLSQQEEMFLHGENNETIFVNNDNSGFVLNLLWAFGLANKNSILENGPMNDPLYEGADNFASTGGWTLAKGDAMEHYSKYNFITPAPEQQKLIEEISQNIYRPCCNNSTYFPDCNHGMAMLGLLELMASEGMGEQEMYKVALQVNSYWFPDTYLTIAKYFEKQGVDWKDVDPKQALGKDFSSATGFQNILKQVDPGEIEGGGACGV